MFEHSNSKTYSEAAYLQKSLKAVNTHKYTKSFIVCKKIPLYSSLYYLFFKFEAICMFYSEVTAVFIQAYPFSTLLWLNESSVCFQISSCSYAVNKKLFGGLMTCLHQTRILKKKVIETE